MIDDNKMKIADLDPPSEEEVLAAVDGGWGQDQGTQQANSNPITEDEGQKEEILEPPIAETPSTKPAEAEETEQPQDSFGGDYGKLKKSYDEVRSWNTRLSQDIADVKRNVESLKPPAVEQEQPKQRTLTYEEMEEWKERDPYSFDRYVAEQTAKTQVDPVRQEVTQMREQLNDVIGTNIVNGFRAKYSDFGSLESEMRDAVSSLPPEVTHNPKYYNQVLENAYWSVKGKQQAKATQNAAEVKQRTVAQKTQNKANAYVEGSGKTAPEQPFDSSKAGSDEIYSYLQSIGHIPKE